MTRARLRNRNPIALQWGLILLTLAIGLLLALGAGIRPLWSYLLAINLATLLTYAWDKRAAPRDGARIPENSLHLMAALGGSVGALVAQLLFHHKNRKRSFQIRFWLIVIGQAVVLLVWLWLSGRTP